MTFLSVKHRINETQFKQIFEHYSGSLYLYALGFLRSEAGAEDVVQEVFIRFWKNRGIELKNEKVIKTYLFNSVRNACLNLLEKKTPAFLKTEELQRKIAEENASRFNEALLEEILQKIQQLSPQTQKIISLVFLQDRTYQEAADEIGISVNTVKTLLRTGIKKLRTHFAGRNDLWLTLFIIRQRYRRK